ncbi:MAG: dihydropteroate synthase, partial [Planctomycetota bacterium]
EALLPLDAPLSIDTRSARVAAACLAAGASWINDVSALSDPAMAPTVAAAGADLCLMHSRGTPADMQRRTGYRHLLGEVIDELAGRCRLALAAGVAPARIQVDPGIGFAKDAEQSLALLGRCGALRGLGFPLLVGPSRKSCLVAALGERPPRQRDAGSAGVAALAAAQGAAWLRLHRGGELWDAVLAAAAAGAAARVLRPAEDAVPEVTG